jgi:hypothetical protein
MQTESEPRKDLHADSELDGDDPMQIYAALQFVDTVLRCTHGWIRARRDAASAMRVVRVHFGRYVGGRIGRIRVWLPVGKLDDLLASRGSQQLAKWWAAQPRTPRWSFRFVAALEEFAEDIAAFPRNKNPNWGRTYLAAARANKAVCLREAERIEETVAQLRRLEADIAQSLIRGWNLPGLLAAARADAEAYLGGASKLRELADEIAIHGKAGRKARSAERGRLVRRMGKTLEPAPPAVRNRFIADLLDHVHWGTRTWSKDESYSRTTLQTVQSILRADAERRSS